MLTATDNLTAYVSGGTDDTNDNDGGEVLFMGEMPTQPERKPVVMTDYGWHTSKLPGKLA
jgi:hypothetical protein